MTVSPATNIRPHPIASTAPASGAPDGLTFREREATAIATSYVTPIPRTASHPLTCATCRYTIPTGAPYREDRLRQPVFGHLLASAICSACTAEGL